MIYVRIFIENRDSYNIDKIIEYFSRYGEIETNEIKQYWKYEDLDEIYLRIKNKKNIEEIIKDVENHFQKGILSDGGYGYIWNRNTCESQNSLSNKIEWLHLTENVI